jgi:hypothetical protein
LGKEVPLGEEIEDFLYSSCDSEHFRLGFLIKYEQSSGAEMLVGSFI